MDGIFIMSVLVELLTMAMVTCIQTFFYYKTIGFSAKWSGYRLALVMLVVSVIIAALELIAHNVPSLIGDIAWWIFFVVIILYPVFFMGGKRRERVLFGFVNGAIFMFSGLLGAVVLNAVITKLSAIQTTSTFFKILIIQGAAWPVILLALLLTTLIYMILVLVITRLNTEGKRFIPGKYWIGMMIGFIIIVAGLYAISNLGIWIEDTWLRFKYVAVGSLGFLVVWLMLYFVFYFVCRYFSKVTEANALAIQNDMIERYMLRKQASDERIRVLSHDLKHSLIQWRRLAEEKGDVTALQNISEYEGQLRSAFLFNVENENANAIINQKYWEATQEHIKFQVDGAYDKDLLISNMDLCSLLGNLLDNAIEAAAQTETEALRCVKLNIRRKGNLLIIGVENGYTKEPVLENGAFVTSKKDKDLHSIGMLSIKYVVEKYDGVIHNSYENNWFKANVMLRGYQSVPSDKN